MRLYIISGTSGSGKSIARRGFLPIVTTRGDRLFISLLGSAYIHLAWIGLTGFAVWIATMISVLFLVIVMRNNFV